MSFLQYSTIFGPLLYDTIATLLDNQKDILKLLQKMYVALKGVPIEELRTELVSKLAEIIHEENKNQTE